MLFYFISIFHNLINLLTLLTFICINFFLRKGLCVKDCYIWHLKEFLICWSFCVNKFFFLMYILIKFHGCYGSMLIWKELDKTNQIKNVCMLQIKFLSIYFVG